MGTMIAIMVFFALNINYAIDVLRGNKDQAYFSLETLSFVVEAFMIGVTIIVVAVPEV